MFPSVRTKTVQSDAKRKQNVNNLLKISYKKNLQLSSAKLTKKDSAKQFAK